MSHLKKDSSSTPREGSFIISLDFELFWGVHDILTKEVYSPNIYGAHQAVPEILNLFRHYDIHATWAVVGMLNMKDMKEFNANIPAKVPEYANKKLSAYYHASKQQIKQQEYDLYFAPALIREIAQAPGQEIGSHTFSHYYCLEKGQSLNTFIADAENFYNVISPLVTKVQTIIFPRNQINQTYLAACRQLGFIAYRGNENGWVYKIRKNDRIHLLKRALRLLDTYINLFGYQTYRLPHGNRKLPVNIPGSRQLKPVNPSLRWLERKRLDRILNAMTYAAKNGEIYHLWWHPHNFGVHLEENLSFLGQILEHYKYLNKVYGFNSKNMGEIAEEALGYQTIKKNGKRLGHDYPMEEILFTINDIYGSFKDEKNMPKADVHCYFQQSDYLDANMPLTLHKKVKTLCIDLFQSEEQLRKDMNRTTRYQINKAGRDNLRVRYITAPSEKDIEEFVSFFNPFAAAKGIELCREDKVAALKKNRKLVISYVHHEDDRKLASHLYIIDGNRATMLYSCSGRFVEEDIPPINIGRANRYLHWNDILFFKQAGYEVYDFLGLSINEKNEEEQNINKFKKGFGGREEINYQSYVPQTKKGMLMLFLLRFKWRNQLELVSRREALVGKQEAPLA